MKIIAFFALALFVVSRLPGMPLPDNFSTKKKMQVLLVVDGKTYPGVPVRFKGYSLFYPVKGIKNHLMPLWIFLIGNIRRSI